MSGTGSDDQRGEDYFRAIETTFIRLRGAPLLLSPADWQTARQWYRQGIPLEVVCDVLESVFAGVRERDPKKRVSSLRYCAPAVEEAWREIRDLSAAGHRLEPEGIDVAERLRELEGLLPQDLRSRESLGEELSGLEGPAEEVERRLEALDARMLEAADRDLDVETRTEIAGRARKALDRALEGVGPGRRDPSLEGRLYREFLRRHLGLPTLSLFSGGSDRGAD